ncbi:MAG: Uma2 family endonuclease [Actinomycetes bacterium]
MAVMTSLHVPEGGWTVDDLPELFPESDVRFELVDGALVVVPPEAPRNGRVASRLLVLLVPLLDDGWDVLLGNGVHFDLRNYREPDLFVCRSEAVDAGRVSARDVLLAVEVMSPSSVATDRVAKPAQYAAAGIPHYWRIEPDPRLLITHELADGAYRESGRFDDRVEVERPVPMQCRLTDLFD